MRTPDTRLRIIPLGETFGALVFQHARFGLLLEFRGRVGFVGEGIHNDRQENNRGASEEQHRVALRLDDVSPDNADYQRQPDSHGIGHRHAGHGNRRDQQHVRQVEDHSRQETKKQVSLAGLHQIVHELKAVRTESAECEGCNDGGQQNANGIIEIKQFESPIAG